MENSGDKLNGLDWVADPDKVRQKIIDAASALYAKKGFLATSLQEVSEMAGVTRTVTRHYVKTESEIMRMIMEDVLTYFKENLLKMTRDIDDPEKKLAAAFDIYLRVVDLKKDKALLIYHASKFLDKASKIRVMQLEVEVSAIFEKILTDGIERGVFKRVDTDLMAYDIMMLAHMWALKGWHFKHRLSLDRYIELQLETLRGALRK